MRLELPDYDAAPGIWLSAWGGYGIACRKRTDTGRARPVEERRRPAKVSIPAQEQHPLRLQPFEVLTLELVPSW